MIFVIIIILLVFAIVIATKAHHLQQGRTVPTTGLLNKAAHRWHDAIAAGEARAPSNLASAGNPRLFDPAEELQEAFDRYKSGFITLSDYHDEIVGADRELRVERDALSAERHLMSVDEYQTEHNRLNEQQDEIAWRLQWVEKRLRDQTLYEARPEISGSGRWARFEYVDSEGEITNRNVANWQVSGRYVRAYDRKRKAERNFRIDRISDWKCG